MLTITRFFPKIPVYTVYPANVNGKTVLFGLLVVALAAFSWYMLLVDKLNMADLRSSFCKFIFLHFRYRVFFQLAMRYIVYVAYILYHDISLPSLTEVGEL